MHKKQSFVRFFGHPIGSYIGGSAFFLFIFFSFGNPNLSPPIITVIKSVSLLWLLFMIISTQFPRKNKFNINTTILSVFSFLCSSGFALSLSTSLNTHISSLLADNSWRVFICGREERRVCLETPQFAIISVALFLTLLLISAYASLRKLAYKQSPTWRTLIVINLLLILLTNLYFLPYYFSNVSGF